VLSRDLYQGKCEIELDPYPPIIILESFALFQNYPNSFNPTTTIKYSIPSNVKRETSYVSLKIYDILGNEVTTLVNKEKHPGEYIIEFSAKGGSASGGNAWNIPSVIYFYQIQTDGYIETKKMLLVK